MIGRLSIQNYAIIDDLEVRFRGGFNVITGETGAGKSIVIEALGLALGERANIDVIRTGTNKALVECEVEVTDRRRAEIGALLRSEDIPAEFPLILRRELRASGRSRAFINDTPCTVSLLKQVGDLLVDMHGQHEHQSLLDPATHIKFLDEFADHEPLLKEVTTCYEEWVGADRNYQQLRKKQRELSEKEDLYRFQLKEIRAANPTPGEMDDLEQQRKILSNSQRIAELVQALQQRLYEGDASIYDEMVSAQQYLQELTQIDHSVGPYTEEMKSAAVTVKEIGNFLNHYGSSLDHDPAVLDQIEERIVALRKLMKKFGPSLEEVLAYRDRVEAALNEFENYDAELNRLEECKREAAEDLVRACERLHNSRSMAATQLSDSAEQVLHALGMERAAFRVRTDYRFQEDSPIAISDHPVAIDPSGADVVEFYITTNPGEGEKPLAQIASGGEISRTMLAIKSVLAGKDGISTVIFDEIDIGISGRISRVVAEHLRQLARYHQVVCITHLPQIASLGEIHYAVGKRVQNNRTTTSIHQLTEEERVREIATLVGGETISEVTLNNARELLKRTDG